MSIRSRKKAEEKNSDKASSLLSTLTQQSTPSLPHYDLDQSFTQVVRQIKRIFKIKSCGIFLYNEKGFLKFKMGLGLSRRLQKTFDSQVSPKLTLQILSSTYSKISNDILVDYKRNKSFRDLLRSENIHKEIGVSLKIKDKLVGILNIWRDSSSPDFLEKDLKLLNVFGDQITTAIMNAELSHQLERNLGRYKNLIEKAPDPILVVDLKGHIVYCNKATEILTGYQKEESLGKDLSQLGLMDKKEFQHSLRLSKVARGGKKVASFERQAKRKNGKPYWAEIRVSNIEEKSKAVGFQVHVRDITECRKIEGALTRKGKVATERARLLNDLRGLDRIDNILTRVCEAVRDSELFERAVMTLHKPGGKIIHLGQVGLPVNIVKRAQHAPPIDDKLRAQITNKRFRISDSFFIPAEAGLDYTKTERHILQKKKKLTGGDWQPGDELFVPLRSFSGEIMGYLSVDTPADGYRPDIATIRALEMFVEAGAARIREVEAHEAVRRERDFSQSILKTASSLIVCLDADAEIMAFNQECEGVTGYRREEVLGKRWPELFLPPDQRHAGLKSFAKWVRAHPRDQYEGPIVTKSGEIRIILWSNTAILGPGEKDVVAIAIGQDITERKQAEAALHRSEERFRLIAETSLDYIFQTRKNGETIYCSPSIERVLGYTPIERQGKDFTSIILPSDLPKARASFKKVIEGETVQNIEINLLHKNGKTVPIEVSVVPIYENKEVTSLFGIARDITERKRTEEALQASENKYRTLLENLPQKIFLKDRNSVFLSCNENLARDFNIKAEEIAGKTDYDFLPKELAEKYRADDKRIMKSGSTEEIEERYMQDGQQVFVHTVKTPVKDEQGNLIGLLGIFWDITDRKRAEEAVRIERDRLETVTKNAGVGLAIISKDYRTLWANEVLKQIFGEVEGKICYSTYNQRTEICPGCGVREIFETGRHEVVHEQVGKGIDGKTICSQIVATPIKDEEGNIIAALEVVMDITQRKRVEEALQTSENKYRTLLENLPQKIFLKDKNSVYLSCNENFAQDLKIKAEEFAGKTDYDFFPKGLAEKYRTDDKRIMRLGKTEDIEEKYIQEGREVFVHTVKTPVKDEQGNIIGLLGIFWDITERKKTDEALRESEERYRGIFEDSPISLLEEDFSEVKTFIDNLKAKGVKDFRKYFEDHPKAVVKCVVMVKTIDVNNASLDLFKAKSKEELQHRLGYTFSEESYDAFREELVAIAQGRHTFETETITQTLKGDKKHVFVRWSVAPGYEKTLSKVLVSISDITELKRAREQNLLLETSKALSRTLKLDQVLKIGTEKIAESLEADRCSVALFDESADSAEIKHLFIKKAAPGPVPPRRCTPPDEHFSEVKEILLTKGYLEVKNVKTSPMPKSVRNYLLRVGTKSFLVIPLIVGNKLFGVFHIGSVKKSRGFTSEEISLAQTIANQVGVAIQNALLIEDLKQKHSQIEEQSHTLEKQYQEQAILMKVSSELSKTLDLNRILQIATTEMTQALQVDRCAVALAFREEGYAEIRSIYLEGGKSVAHLLGYKLYPHNFPQAQEMFEKRRLINIPNIYRLPDKSFAKKYFLKEGIKSAIFVPMVHGKKLVGFFVLSTMKDFKTFTPEEKKLAQTIADQVAVAIENARLLELLKKNEDNLRRLNAQLMNIQEDERKKLAQKLHDEIGQTLFAMKMNLDMTKKNLPINIEGFEDMNDRLSDSENLLSETIDQIRNLTTDLRPSMLDDFGLMPALKWYVENFSKRTNVKVYLKTKNLEPRLSSEVETTLYRILQEALTNVAKHAQATQVSILLRRENHFASLLVQDNGIGFETMKTIPAKDKFGLFNIKERVELLNGKFEIRSKPNKGTKLNVRIPLTEARV